MKKLLPLLIAPLLAFPLAAAAKKQGVKVSGAQTETHISGANATQSKKNGAVHASGGATTSDAGKVVDAIGKAAFANDAGRNAPRNSSSATHQLDDDHPAPGEVRQPRQPKQATVEPPRSPELPRGPDIPRNK